MESITLCESVVANRADVFSVLLFQSNFLSDRSDPPLALRLGRASSILSILRIFGKGESVLMLKGWPGGLFADYRG